MTMPIHYWESLSAAEQRALLERPALRADGTTRIEVEAILRHVREQGDAAVREYTRRFDGVELTHLRVSETEFAAAEQRLSRASIAAIELAIANVRRFHDGQRAAGYSVEIMPGVRCERVCRPIDAVGLYVPAGTAPLPSTAVMLAVPAALAACPRRVLCSPPRPGGEIDPAVLVAARRSGVDEVYKVGGVQAIAAMAYGTESLPRVDKVFGPGNAWVTAAKSLIAADMSAAAVDMAAGPSEVLVIADASANPGFVAADLLSQAEHGDDSQVLLVTTDAGQAVRVLEQLERQLPLLARNRIAHAALAHGRMIVAGSLQVAIAISNAYAPEHLIVQTVDPRALLPQIRTAGSVFLGPWSPESAGDYCSGTNHVLPTYGQARSSGGLCVEQFMRHMTVQELSQAGLRSLAGAITELAMLEGLDAHAAAVHRRLAADHAVEALP
jgi:histidinol dehydrogenase